MVDGRAASSRVKSAEGMRHGEARGGRAAGLTRLIASGLGRTALHVGLLTHRWQRTRASENPRQGSLHARSNVWYETVGIVGMLCVVP